MTYLFALTAGASIALCLLLAKLLREQCDKTVALCRALRAERDTHAEEIARAETDSFAAGFEACAEQMGEVEIECGCERCRVEKYAIN